MTLPEVQFCLAVANGDSDQVRQLVTMLNEKQSFQKNDYNVFLLLFCFKALSSAREGYPEALNKMLQEHFPEEKQSQISHDQLENIKIASQMAIEAMMPSILNNFSRVLFKMADYLGPDDDDDLKQWVVSCIAVLDQVMDLSLPDHFRKTAEDLRGRLSKIYITPDNAPSTPDILKEVLNKEKGLYYGYNHSRTLGNRLDCSIQALRESASQQKETDLPKPRLVF